MWNKLAIAAGALSVVAVVAAAVGAAWSYVSLIRPLNTLPRPQADIEADWAQVQPWLPTHVGPGEGDAAFTTLLDAVREEGASDASVAELVAWVDHGGRLPEGGCTLLPGDPPEPTIMDVFDASQRLIERGEPDTAWELADQLSTQAVLGLMVGQAIQRAIEPDQASDPSRLFQALTAEVACSDAVFESLVDGTLGQEAIGDQASFLDVELERLKYRDASARLLLALHPIRDDAVAQRKVLDGFVAFESPRFAPLAGVLLFGVVSVSADYLTDPVDAQDAEIEALEARVEELQVGALDGTEAGDGR